MRTYYSSAQRIGKRQLQETIRNIAVSVLETSKRHGPIKKIYVPSDEWAVLMDARPVNATPDWRTSICGAFVLPLSECN